MFKIFSAFSGISGLVGGAFAYQKTKTNAETFVNASPSKYQYDSPFTEKFEIKFVDDDKKMVIYKNIFAVYSDAIIEKYELDKPYSEKRREFYEKYNQWAYFDDETKEKKRIIEEKIQAAEREWNIRKEKLKNNNNSKEIKV